MRYPTYRPRRLRAHPRLRDLVRESEPRSSSLVQPFFVRPGTGIRNEIPSMRGVYQHSIDTLIPEVEAAVEAGVGAVLLFGIPESKDEQGSQSASDDGIIPMAVRACKERTSALVITDVCLCEYADHGHCGVVRGQGDGATVENDPTLELLARQAVAHARAGADIVAPSDMMDGRVAAIRRSLDEAELSSTPILSYAAKFASAFYGPFREAVESSPRFGDRRSYQLDPANADEALREVRMDIDEGADIVMVKPALAYLDLIRRVKTETGYPVAAYSASGEYAMVKAAAANGWIEEKAAVLEILTSIRRAGADIIITYWARQAAEWLAEG
ncbi:MAG: porphobilinogen synthase [Planctomycetota bacterium]|nr:porphobilinogen synthase [Planctomycetota bacterium]